MLEAETAVARLRLCWRKRNGDWVRRLGRGLDVGVLQRLADRRLERVREVGAGRRVGLRDVAVKDQLAAEARREMPSRR